MVSRWSPWEVIRLERCGRARDYNLVALWGTTETQVCALLLCDALWHPKTLPAECLHQLPNQKGHLIVDSGPPELWAKINLSVFHGCNKKMTNTFSVPGRNRILLIQYRSASSCVLFPRANFLLWHTGSALPLQLHAPHSPSHRE